VIQSGVGQPGDPAVVGQIFSGNYCVLVYDLGILTRAETYTVVVSHSVAVRCRSTRRSTTSTNNRSTPSSLAQRLANRWTGAEAKRVRALAKPTVGAWAVNQVLLARAVCLRQGDQER